MGEYIIDEDAAVSKTYETQLLSMVDSVAIKNINFANVIDGLKVLCVIDAAERANKDMLKVNINPSYIKYGIL